MAIDMHTQDRSPLVLRRASADQRWFNGDTLRFLASADQTGGALSLTEAIVAPEAGPLLHLHPDSDELVVVLAGGIRSWSADGEAEDLGVGDCLFVERGVLHGYVNTGDAPARLLIQYSPAGPEQLWLREGDPAIPGQSPKPWGADRLTTRLVSYAASVGTVIPSLIDDEPGTGEQPGV